MSEGTISNDVLGVVEKSEGEIDGLLLLVGYSLDDWCDGVA